MPVQPAATLTPIPEFPALADRAAGTYNSKAYAFGAHMGTPGPFVAQVNALASNVQANATDAATSAATANTKAGEASTSATTATTKADEASGSATAAASSATTASGHVATASGHATDAGNSATAAAASAVTANTKAGEASTSATTATTAATTATTKADEASGSATAAASSAVAAAASAGDAQAAQAAAAGAANYKGAWSSLSGALSIPAAVSEGGRIWVLQSNIPDVALKRPGMDPVWLPITAPVTQAVLPDPRVIDTTKSITLAAAWTVPNARTCRAITLDSDRELLILAGTGGVHACAYNRTTDTMGAAVLVRTEPGVRVDAVAHAAGADKALIVSLPISTTALQAVVLTVSGLTVTVGTAETATLAGNYTQGTLSSVPFGTGCAIGYTRATSTTGMRAITVSGAAATIGNELNIGSSAWSHALTVIDASRILTLTANGTLLNVLPVSVSGSTLTAGTAATTACTGAFLSAGVLSTGRFAVAYLSSANVTSGAVIDVPSTTATLTTAVLASQPFNVGTTAAVVSDATLLVGGANFCNTLTDVAGVATAGANFPVSRGTQIDAQTLVVAITGSSGDAAFAATVVSGALNLAPISASMYNADAWPISGANARNEIASTAHRGAGGCFAVASGALFRIHLGPTEAVLCSTQGLGAPVARVSDATLWYAAQQNIAGTSFQLIRATLP